MLELGAHGDSIMQQQYGMRAMLRGAGDALRREWNGPDDYEAFDHLRERGFQLTDDLRFWVVPANFNPSEQDLRAVDFLHMEWGYPSRRFMAWMEEETPPWPRLN